ncbi:hypothetical protein MHYP_G00263000 [Metynnis hypsauchen]
MSTARLQCGQMAVMFSNVKYRAIDYSCEVSARNRLTKNLLMLPVPILLDRNIYPHTGHVQKTYRAPWTHGNLRSMCQLELDLTGSVLDCLKTKLCGLDSLERFGVSLAELAELGEVVPSSNPVSQCSVRSDEALWLQRAEREAGHHEWRDSFTPADINSACFSYQDLFLPEEMIVSDHLKQFRSQLPSFLKLVQRSKVLTVPDPLHHMSGVFISGRQLEPYDVCCDEPPSSLAAQSVEEFRKESILSAESLMLPVGIEQVVVRKRDFMLSISSLLKSLNITPEPAEEQSSLIDALRKASPAGVLSSLGCERFDAPVSDSDVTNRTMSPVPYKSYVEMETDLILSPPDRPVLPELFLSASQLAAEPLSPVYRQVLLSDSDREAMEKAVWMAEKHPPCVAELLLAEPQISSPSVRRQSLPELLSLLEAERETQSSDSLTNRQRLSTFTLLPQKPTQWSLTEPMTVEKHTVPDTGEDPTEQFSLLSLIQIDELLKNSAERAVQDLPVSVRERSVQSKAVLTSVPSRVEAGKAVKFILLEEAPQKQSTISESRETATEPMAANECPPKDTQSGVILSTPVSTENLNHLSENTPKKEDSSHLKTDLNQPPHTPAERHGGIPSKTPLDPPDDLEVAKVVPVEQKLEDSLTSTVSTSLVQSFRQGGESELNPAALQSSWRSFSVSKPQDLDPLSSFIMLRTVQRSLAVQKPQQIPLNTAVADPAQKYMRKPTLVLGVSEKAKNSKASLRITEKAFSKTIYVQATENERFAYFELHALARPSLSRVRELDQKALRSKDFISLTPEDTRFYLKQQEKLLSMSRGGECVYDDMALLHILVRVKELLLRCDLTTAIDYMEEAQSTCSMGGLKELLRRLQVLQYMTYRKEEKEPRPRVLQLWEQMSIYLQTNTSNTVLVVTATERVRAELVTALSQVPGSCVFTVLPEGMNKVDSRTVTDSLSCSRSVIVCRQQIGSDFPWQRFSVVLELDSLCHSNISSFCSENNVNYICFCTAMPKTDPAVSPQAYLDSVPFLVFVTEGLLKHSDLLHLLESTYNMTLLERSYSQSMQRLESADRYDVITVDEKTAILLQDLEELQREKASNSVVIRLSALSLQFSRCWIILHCAEQHSKLVYGNMFNNLVMIYSSFVLFGLKSEDLDIKVFLVRDVADIAWYVYQICLHTLLSSERSVWSWLDRDWFSVLQTEEESCLVCFPCINPMVSQLMLRRAPSLQWLLEASFSELKDKFPEIPHKVCKLFSDVTALHRLSAAPSPSEPENTAPLQSNDNLCPPHPPHPQLPHWAVNGDEPHSDSFTDTQLFLTSSSTELSSPESVQQQGTVGTGWHWTVCGASVGQSECVCNSRLQPWPGEHAQNESYTDSFGEGEDQWTVDASSLSAPDLSYSYTHTPAQAVLLGQISPVEEMKTLPLPPWRNSACGTSSRGQQSITYSISPQYQRWVEQQHILKGTERKRPAGDTAGETVFPQCKRGRLLFERIPGRCDGQTRLRFF